MGRRSTSARSILVAAAVLAVSAFGAACGGDDDDSGSDEASATDVTVTAKEYSFDLSATPTADTQQVTLTNEGKLPHVLVFARINEGFTLDEAFKLEGEKGSATEVLQPPLEAKPGQTKTTTVKGPLESGSYAMVCPIPAGGGKTHYDLGQVQEFEIE
jgi:plastocyanin